MKGMEEDMEIEKLQGIIEAILFTMGDSVELGKIAAAIEHDEDTTKKIIHNMMLIKNISCKLEILLT